MLLLPEIRRIVLSLLKKYHAESALLFGSYARGDATASSDIDLIIIGGNHFRKRDIFALAEDFREMTGKQADVFEISEVDQNSPFYYSVMREGIKIA